MLSVLVVSPVIVGAMRSAPPTPSATVRLDKPGGEHVEATTDANGKVTFSGIDWTLGTAGVSGYVDGRAAYGVADIGPSTFKSIPNGPDGEKADVVLFLFPASPKASVALTATLENKQAAGDSVVVSASTGPTFVDGVTTTAAMTVRDGTPFTLVAREYSVQSRPGPNGMATTSVRWASFDQPAPMKPSAQVTLDLAAGGTTLTPTTAHVRVVIPGGVAGPLGRSAVFATVTSAESADGMLLGGVSTATLAADKGSFDTTIEMVTLAGQTPETRYILAATDGSNTSVFKLAAPAEGATVDGFLAPIPIAFGSQSLAKPIDLTGAAPESVTRLIVPDSTDGAVYLVDAPPGTKQMHVPTLSDAAKAFVKKGGSDARLLSLAGNEPSRSFYTKTAVSSAFSVTIP